MPVLETIRQEKLEICKLISMSSEESDTPNYLLKPNNGNKLDNNEPEIDLFQALDSYVLKGQKIVEKPVHTINLALNTKTNVNKRQKPEDKEIVEIETEKCKLSPLLSLSSKFSS